MFWSVPESFFAESLSPPLRVLSSAFPCPRVFERKLYIVKPNKLLTSDFPVCMLLPFDNDEKGWIMNAETTAPTAALVAASAQVWRPDAAPRGRAPSYRPSSSLNLDLNPNLNPSPSHYASCLAAGGPNVQISKPAKGNCATRPSPLTPASPWISLNQLCRS